MVKAKTIQIDADQAEGTIVNLSEYAGYGLLLIRGGLPLISSKYSVLPEGGFELTTEGDKLILNETFAVFPLPSDSILVVTGSFNVSQYPHLLRYTTASGSIQDGQGNWTDPVETIRVAACRYEPESRTVFVEGIGGTQIRITGNVYMPLPAITIQPGTKVEILNDLIVLSQETVKRHSAGQLNQRLWL